MPFHQASEGIVIYSKSGTAIQPNADCISVGINAWLDTGDWFDNGNINYGGGSYVNYEYLAVSDNLIETIDLISEGEIEGLVSGEWITSGNLGQTGWASVYFSGFADPTGLSGFAWLRSVYWDEIPVLSATGQLNFQNVDLAYTVGTPNGDVIQDLTNQEQTSKSIGTRLYAGDENAQIYRILNTNCKGCIVNVKVPELSYTDTQGDIGRALVQWSVAYSPLFSNIIQEADLIATPTQTIFGKMTSAGAYVQSNVINFNLTTYFQNGIPFTEPETFLNDPNFQGWTLKITRINPDSTDTLRIDGSYIDSITELYGSQMSYPNSALVMADFDAQFFSQIPSRAFDTRFMKVFIPANYDPIMKTYASGGYGTTNGYWNGTFSSGKYWTDNPAWCFYDLITNRRYGLGKFIDIDSLGVSIWDLYSISQYCDVMVPNMLGKVEPRFTCNLWLSQRDEAFKIINDMASIFRTMVYYANGTLYPVQDCPKTPRYIFTNANVENGDFNYSSTSRKTRQSIAIVKYNDPINFYEPTLEYVENFDAIRRYGIREINLAAFGCTSRGQAIRLGRWALLTNNVETETITFNAGIETTLLKCGDVFGVTDYNRKGQRYGGRLIQTINTTTPLNPNGAILILDGQTYLQTGIQYDISILSPSYYYDPTQVTGITSNDYSTIYKSFIQKSTFSGDNTYISGNNTIIYLTGFLDGTNYNLTNNNVWSIELGQNSLNYTGAQYFPNFETDYYRVLNVKEVDINKYEIVGLSYWQDKFNQIDSGIIYQESNLYQNINTTPTTPSNLALNAFTGNGTNYIWYAFTMDNFNYVDNYQIFAYTGNFVGNGIPSNTYQIATLPVNITQAVYLPPSTGNYNFRIYSYNNEVNLYSANFAAGSVLVTDSLPIENVQISLLEIS